MGPPARRFSIEYLAMIKLKLGRITRKLAGWRHRVTERCQNKPSDATADSIASIIHWKQIELGRVNRLSASSAQSKTTTATRLTLQSNWQIQLGERGRRWTLGWTIRTCCVNATAAAAATATTATEHPETKPAARQSWQHKLMAAWYDGDAYCLLSHRVSHKLVSDSS